MNASLIDLRLNEKDSALGQRTVQAFFQQPDGLKWGFQIPVAMGATPHDVATAFRNLADGIVSTAANPPKPSPAAAAPDASATPASPSALARKVVAPRKRGLRR
jgi:hypothetical protein